MQKAMDAFIKFRESYFSLDGTSKFVNAIAENGEEEIAKAFWAGWVMSQAPTNIQQQVQADSSSTPNSLT